MTDGLYSAAINVPPPDPDYVCNFGDPDDWYSVEVLATDNQCWYVCRYHHNKNTELDYDHSCWVISGRDGYHFDNVTRWLHLPKLPID